MSDENYQPVFHDHEAFLKKALQRPEFKEDYVSLAQEYALAWEMLAARALGCRLEIRLIPDGAITND